MSALSRHLLPAVLALLLMADCQHDDDPDSVDLPDQDLRVLSPPAGAHVHNSVEVRAGSDTGLHFGWLALMVDGDSLGLWWSRPYVCSLNLRDLTPGDHTLALRGAGTDWVIRESEPVSFTVESPLDRTWTLSSDSAHLAIFFLDSRSYRVERGSLTTLPPCGCGPDSLPLSMTYRSPVDDGWVHFHHAATGDTVLDAGIMWMGTGRVERPMNLIPAGDFARRDTPLPAPAHPVFFRTEYGPSQEHLPTYADSIWSGVAQLDLAQELAARGATVGYYYYPPCVGVLDPRVAKWVVFLFWENS